MKSGVLNGMNDRFAGALCRGSLPCVTALVIAAFCAQTVARADVFDDFTDGNDTANPIWTHSDVGLGGVQTYDASGQNYHLSATVGGNGFSYLGSFVDPAADFMLSCDLLSWGGGAQKFGLYARATGINTFLGVSGYHFSYQPDNGQVLIRRMTSANQAGSNRASTTYFLDTSKDYRFVFWGSGTYLEGDIYEIGGPADPVVRLTGTDTVYTTGLSGVLGFGLGVNTDFTVDNFLMVIPEPATSALLLLGALAGWPLLRRRAVSE